MKEDISFKGKQIYIVFVIILTLAVFFSYWFGTQKYNVELSLLGDYQKGFETCRLACLGVNKTGYIRAITDNHHECHCLEG